MTAPRWLLIVASALISFHLLSLGVCVLASISGPWPTFEEGSAPAPPPRFAHLLYKSLPGDYLQAVQLTNNYHFDTDRTARTGIYLEARLKDSNGREFARVKYPEDGVNFWVRHRQQLLMDKIGGDEAVVPPQTERVAAPNRPVEMVTIWDEYENRKMRLKSIDLNSLIGSTRPAQKPSDWAMAYVRSYARHLCRTHGAASVEIIRHFQEPITVDVLTEGDNIPAGAFDEYISNFGEFPR
jgi:hypothetical protein